MSALGIGHISHRPRRGRYQKTKHVCVCGRTEYGTAKWQRCRVCQKRHILDKRREARHLDVRGPQPDWRTEPRPLSLVRLDAQDADEHLREKGIVIQRNGRPLADWYRELIATAGLTQWRGEIKTDAEFAVEHDQTPLARIEAQDVEGRRTYRR